MKTKITVILVIFTTIFISSCQSEYDFSLNPLNIETGQVKTETWYCCCDPETEVRSIENAYDSQGNLILVTEKSSGVDFLKTEKEFNRSGQITTEKVYHFTNEEWELNYTYEYIYSGGLLQKKITKNYDGSETNKIEYSYRGSKPEWEDFYRFSDGEWLFNYAHKYEFNRNGKLIKKSSYNTAEKDAVYDYFTYSYKNNRLSEEERILITGKVGYHKDYFYNNDGTLDHVVKDENIIEQYYYENGSLTEKRSWYYGIDPCFSLCCGNIICKYEY